MAERPELPYGTHVQTIKEIPDGETPGGVRINIPVKTRGQVADNDGYGSDCTYTVYFKELDVTYRGLRLDVDFMQVGAPDAPVRAPVQDSSCSVVILMSGLVAGLTVWAVRRIARG